MTVPASISAAASMTLKQAMGDVSATSNSEKGGPGSLITTSSVSTTNGKIRSKGKMGGGGGVKINENSRHHYLIDEDGEDEGTGAGQTGFLGMNVCDERWKSVLEKNDYPLLV